MKSYTKIKRFFYGWKVKQTGYFISFICGDNQAINSSFITKHSSTASPLFPPHMLLLEIWWIEIHTFSVGVLWHPAFRLFRWGLHLRWFLWGLFGVSSTYGMGDFLEERVDVESCFCWDFHIDHAHLFEFFLSRLCDMGILLSFCLEIGLVA